MVFRVLQNLLILDGERLSYRTLDVEQIGSVYETMMGFNLEVAQGRSIAIKPTKPHGAPTTINLEELRATKPSDRAKWLKEKTDLSLTGQAAAALKEAATPEDAVAALERKVSFAATPRVVPAGAMVLQPSDERRRSGSHYTPRTLTEPIIETTFRPIMERLGPNPTPEQILDLKVCDPAMGSGAFLVAVCRFLADLLVKAWHAHKCVPAIPPDEVEILHARRIVAQRCLYGVDKNPIAVDLAKLSLWLATLAKDHPFTFLDHALRHGDSLVGLSKKQIEAFHWKPERQRDFSRAVISDRISRATCYRREIREAAEATPESLLSQKLALADEALNPLRFYGDLVIAAFFAVSNDRQRKTLLDESAEQLSAYLHNPHKLELREALDEARRALLEGEKQVHPFHWEIEFPEVFGRQNAGFDAFVGNPPFMGGSKISGTMGSSYLDWLLTIHDESHGNGDLVAHFYRRSFALLRDEGAFGLIATNTIGQGDTRSTGLRWICGHGGSIYEAIRRTKWPGQAAVTVSIVYVAKSAIPKTCHIDGKPVSQITAYLFHQGGHDNPHPLAANHGLSFSGVKITGSGFLFDSVNSNELSTPISEMERLIAKNPDNAALIQPYIGGEELNESPTQDHHRYVINFGTMHLEQARRWPDLLEIVESKVRSTRSSRLTTPWWQFERPRPELMEAMRSIDRVLAISLITKHLAFSFKATDTILSHMVVVLIMNRFTQFAIVQSRIHEVWARFQGSTFEDRPIYTPTTCFETFPMPEKLEANPALELVGRDYYEFRADLMFRNNEGLTKTYNRFNDPDERSPDILKLRELHAAMDRAVLDAYGWTDLKPTCEFLLDYEDEMDQELATSNQELPTRHRRKPWRYRWPDDFRDEVLARLLELNRERAEQERLSGPAAEAGRGKPTRKPTAGRKAASKNPDQPEFFES